MILCKRGFDFNFSKGCKVSSREIEPLLKLLGYSDPEVHFVSSKDETSNEIVNIGEGADGEYSARLHSTLPSTL